MEEKKALPEEPTEEVDLNSDDSRREFMTKVMGAAGAIAAAGLLGGAASQSASAETVRTRRAAPVAATAIATATAMQPAGAVALKSQKLKNGFALQMTGRDIGKVLQRENLLPRGASPDKVAVKLELST